MDADVRGLDVVLAEPDYRFGAGKLRLRIISVDRGNPVRYDGDDWYAVHGTEIGHDGTEVGRRLVMVRRPAVPVPLR